MAVGTAAYNPLEEGLKAAGFEVHVVGDAKQPRKVVDAISEGYQTGKML